MIPKIIHFCWLSGDEYPDLIKKCMASWKEKLPDYELMLWDAKRFDIEGNTWVKQAFQTKKYAFAADYIRLYAVYNHGGIYLDTDIEIVKSFNPLLQLPYFMGSEGDTIIEAGVFGAQKHTLWLKDCLNYYKDKNFIKNDGSLDTLTLPRIMMKQIQQNHNILEMANPDTEQKLITYPNKNIYLFPYDYFCAKNHGTGIIEKSVNTYSIHHFAMSWLPKSETFLPNVKRRLMRLIGVNNVNNLITFFGLKKLRNKFSK